ncbi:MAG: 3-demethylubiquinone-9 3-O-methyltransferase [Nanoarchaeota archaeon]|nr:3-demethylubiquinone-9 3-O-methyltransferase [Nanoarchaeota archaeon]
MKQSLKIYDEVDWWNPKHSLQQMVPIKFDYFKEKVGNLKGLKILDLGCGGGLLSEEFAKGGAKVTGIDISENSLKIAETHASKNNLIIAYKKGYAENIPVNDNTFDAVICADCLEHVDNLEKVISEISRVLKNNGIFCYDTINRTFLSKFAAYWIANKILRWQNKHLNVSEKNYAVHDWNRFIKPAELYQSMKRYALKNIEIKGIQFAGIKNGSFKAKIGKNTKIAYIGYAQKIG